MTEAADALGLVLRAIGFAAHKHRDQRRKNPEATPYVNHPIRLAELLHTEGGVDDPVVLAAALLHDTIEDTATSYEELRGHFGVEVADVVVEVTDVKFVGKAVRKRLQVERAGRASERARLVKLADKICNLQDCLSSPPVDWTLAQQQAYFDFARDVVDKIRGVNPRLEQMFDELYRRRPQA